MDNYAELLKLLQSREELMDNTQLKYEHWKKLHGEKNILPGYKCFISFDYAPMQTEEGNVFVLPGVNYPDEDDVFIHVPSPSNPDGVDDPGEVFVHLYDLLINENVIKITIKDPNNHD